MGKKRDGVKDDEKYFVIGSPLRTLVGPKSFINLFSPVLLGTYPVAGILEQRTRQKRPLLVGIVF